MVGFLAATLIFCGYLLLYKIRLSPVRSSSNPDNRVILKNKNIHGNNKELEYLRKTKDRALESIITHIPKSLAPQPPKEKGRGNYNNGGKTVLALSPWEMNGSLEALYARWSRESEDEVETAEVNERLAAFFKQNEIDDISYNAICTDSLCRLEFSADKIDNFEALRKLPNERNQDIVIDNYPHTGSEGANFIVYMGREGISLEDIIETEGRLSHYHERWKADTVDEFYSKLRLDNFTMSMDRVDAKPISKEISCRGCLCRVQLRFSSLTELARIQGLSKTRGVEYVNGPPVKTLDSVSIVIYFTEGSLDEIVDG